MDVGEKREQTQHRHDLELQLLRFVRHSLGQRVHVQIEVADRQNGDKKENADPNHQHIALTRGSDKSWQMMGRGGMK